MHVDLKRWLLLFEITLCLFNREYILSSNLQMSVDMQDTECCFLEEKLLLEFLEVQMFFDVVLSTPEPVHTR